MAWDTESIAKELESGKSPCHINYVVELAYAERIKQEKESLYAELTGISAFSVHEDIISKYKSIINAIDAAMSKSELNCGQQGATSMSEIKHYTIVTTRGLEKIQAAYHINQTVNLTHMGFGGIEVSMLPLTPAAIIVSNQWAKIPLERHPENGFIAWRRHH